MKKAMQDRFDLTGKTALITGCAGFLGTALHAPALLECGARVILTDWHEKKCQDKAQQLIKKYNLNKNDIFSYYMDVTDKKSIHDVISSIYDNNLQIDILINNASTNPKVSKNQNITPESRFETMTEEYFRNGTEASVFGTFLTTQIVANKMLTHSGNHKGTIINILSDLSVIVSDNRLYRQKGIDENQQPVKPITYSIAKFSQLAMVRYLAAYFADKGIRVNALSPSGVYNDNIPEDFVKKLSDKIPLGKMSHEDDYKTAIAFLCSDSPYMIGHNLICDGGKSIW